MLIRPKRLPEALWAWLGAGLLIALRLIPLAGALAAIAKGYDVYFFLLGMMILAELARQEGAFDWFAALALRAAAGSRKRLFTLVYVLGVGVTTLLSNDATAIVLTPAVYAMIRRADGDPMPYLFACALIANAASFVLPISNPANLVVFGSNVPSLLPWLRTFLLPACGAIFATYLTLRILFGKDLRGALPNVVEELRLSPGGKFAILGVIVTAGLLLFCSATGRALGLPTMLSALTVALIITLFDRPVLLHVARGISWSVIPLVAGLFVVIEGLNSAGGLDFAFKLLAKATQWPERYADFSTAFGFGISSNLINNLPVGLIGANALHTAAVSGDLANAMLVGIDLGPNLSVTGSLATLLWLIALRRENVEVGAWRFFKIGVIAMPAALGLAVLFLSLASPDKKNGAHPTKPRVSNFESRTFSEFQQTIPAGSTDTTYAPDK
jgi:arsenical pump membrane protein